MKHIIPKAAVILLFISLFLLSGCQLIDFNPSNNGKVDIYLLSSWHKAPDSERIMEEKPIELYNEPLVSYDEIIWYDQEDFSFKLMESARQKIIDLENSGHRLAFAVTANDSIVYTAYFWASFSSSICDWVVIDPLVLHSSESMKVRLGYPGFLPEFNIPDKRNDPAIIQIFKDSKKLKR